MPDIAMCRGAGCPRRDRCYRYTARPERMQSYFAVPPIKPDGSCDYFADIDVARKEGT